MSVHKNRKIVLNIIALMSLGWLCLGAGLASSAENRLLLAMDTETSERLAAYRQQIEDLEYEFGPYHASLIEPLASMIEMLNELGDYEQVAELQSRQLQVMRTAMGFEHPDLIPLLQEIMSTEMALGNWEAISDHLEHIRHLHSVVDGNDAEQLLLAVQDQINWLYSRITIEDRREQARHLFEIRDLYEEIEDLVDEVYGEESLEAVPWRYKLALNEFHLVQFLNASKGLGGESIDRLVRRDGTFKLESQNRFGFSSSSLVGNSSIIPVVDKGRPVGDAYLRDAYTIVNKLQDVLVEKGDAEAQAMIKIYRSDFQLLADRGSAIRGYREAREMLLELGIAEADLNWFFERPMVIPMETLHLNFADALAEIKERVAASEPTTDEGIQIGLFTSWDEALESTSMPRNDDPFWHIDYPFVAADVSFSVNSRGKASSVDVLATYPDELDTKRSVWRSVRDIQFRPAIIDNKERRVKDVRMRYQFIDED